MDALQQQTVDFFSRAMELWLQGGWAMILIAINALVMFALSVTVYLRLRGTGFRSVKERTWRNWIDEPNERRGPIGELLDFVMGARTLKDMEINFEEVRATEIAPFERDLRVVRICVAAAPLLGLLGTVTGILATFDALSKGSGGEKTMGMVAAGISEALITTETGLIIAIPGLFLQHVLSRNTERYKAFLAHLETVCTQTVYHRQKQQRQDAAA
jgi:biopolymer transport protein ExbB